MKASIGVVSLLFFAAMTASALTISQFTPRAVVSPRVYLQEAGFTAEQTAALEEASISLRRVGEQKTDFGLENAVCAHTFVEHKSVRKMHRERTGLPFSSREHTAENEWSFQFGEI